MFKKSGEQKERELALEGAHAQKRTRHEQKIAQ